MIWYVIYQSMQTTCMLRLRPTICAWSKTSVLPIIVISCIWHLMFFVLSEENYVLCASEIIEIKANFLWSFNSFYEQLDCLWMYHEGTFCILLHIGLQLLEIKESFHLVHFYKAIYFFVQKEDILFCEQNIFHWSPLNFKNIMWHWPN